MRQEVIIMKQLIAYFSRADENYFGGQMKYVEVGNTEIAAQKLQKLTGADLFRIEMKCPYSPEYKKCVAEAVKDKKENARPELAGFPESIGDYDEIFLGYPSYCGTMPMAVFTFLEHFDFSGKKIRPFCTNEGSGMEQVWKISGNSARARKWKTACPSTEAMCRSAMNY